MTSPGEFPHLLPEVALVAVMSDEKRAQYIDSDRWLPYQRANEILNELEDLVKRPRVSRPPNIMIVARSDNGKSHILDRFSALHPGIPNVNGPNIFAPVMLLETPPTASANDLYDILLNLLNRPRPSSGGPDARRGAAKDILQVVETKVLMLDEINHLLSGSVNRQREFLFALKYLSNELKLSVVIAGTPESLQLLHVSDQIENRFRPLHLPVWEVSKEMRTLLANFEQVLPLQKPSGLSSRAMATLISSFGVETIGAISQLLNNAAKLAIKSGTECISADILKQCAPKTRRQIKDDLSKL